MRIVKKEVSKSFTVDVEVENTHSYQLENGVVTHNSVSQRVGSASGIHPRYSPYYIRRVRVSKSDAIFTWLVNAGVPYQPEVGEDPKAFSTGVFEFPIKSPKKAVFRTDKNAIQQLEHWKLVQKHWCEHKPSITVYVKDNEWLEVGAWVYKHWKYISGISFLPFDNGVYELAPYEEITEETYKQLCKEFPRADLDFEGLSDLEVEDHTTGSQELSCSAGGSCDIR